VAFDVTHPPTSVEGAFTCPNEIGTFALRLVEQP
jgi:hypothetical protein